MIINTLIWGLILPLHMNLQIPLICRELPGWILGKHEAFYHGFEKHSKQGSLFRTTTNMLQMQI